MNYKIAKILILVVINCCFNFAVRAQRDTIKKPSIDINSSYKPVLRNAVKINFSGSQLAADTSRPKLLYTIPSQNLFYAYQPISVKPLALVADTGLYLGDRHYIKAGFGGYSTPYLEAGISLGDGKKSLVNIYGSYLSSTGKIKNQDYSNLSVKGTGSYFTPANEIYGGVGFRNNDVYLYGYDHNVYDYRKQEVKQQLQSVFFNAGMRNIRVNSLGINYHPDVQVDFFTNRDKATETTVTVELPVNRKFGENFLGSIAFSGAFTNYNTLGNLTQVSVRNNQVSVSPALLYAKPLLSIHAGVTPAWNNGRYVVFPNIYFEAQLKEKIFMVHGGWIGHFTKNTYQNLINANPYLLPVNSQTNTRETELYGGIKGSLGKHFNFNTKAGIISYNDMPLFINDTASVSNGFIISNEPIMNNFRLHGDAAYLRDKFSLNAGITFNGYTGMKKNVRAWNTLPLELTASLRWQAFNKLLLKSDLYMFGGGHALVNKTDFPMSGGLDIGLGAEYKINRQFSAWLKVNNLLDDKYERWHNYPVYGINLLGGILIHF